VLATNPVGKVQVVVNSTSCHSTNQCVANVATQGEAVGKSTVAHSRSSVIMFLSQIADNERNEKTAHLKFPALANVKDVLCFVFRFDAVGAPAEYHQVKLCASTL